MPADIIARDFSLGNKVMQKCIQISSKHQSSTVLPNLAVRPADDAQATDERQIL